MGMSALSVEYSPHWWKGDTAMRYLTRAGSLFLGVLMILHGIAHGPGVLGSWNLATFEDVSRQPNILLEHAGDGVIFLLGALYLLAGLGFVVAGAATLLRVAWWPRIATAAVLLSLVVTTLWWRDAIAGLVINMALLAVLAGVALRSAPRQDRLDVGSPEPA
jgi:hypothetical protein